VVTGSPPNLVELSNLNKQFGDISMPLSSVTSPALLFLSAGRTGVVTGLVVLSNQNKQFGDNSAPLSCAT
jgi:hypothetical protein